jgi:hypothetical protein
MAHTEPGEATVPARADQVLGRGAQAHTDPGAGA